MRFCSLGSGSAGNATVVEASDGSTTSRLLVDCGFSLRELSLRLGRAGLQPDDIDAMFVTHEHGDHIGCAVALARRYRLPVWMSRGTWQAIGEAITLGDLQVMPYTVVHDAREPLQLNCSDGDNRLGILTDAGSITQHLIAHLQGCDALLLECNHDSGMLAASRYPASVKARIGGRLGHLANDTSAEILAACVHPGLQLVVAAHLSEQNNRPEFARAALAQAWGTRPAEIYVADALTGFDWLSLG